MAESNSTLSSRELDCLRVALLHRQGTVAQLTALLNVSIYAFVVRHVIPTQPLLWWTAVMAILYVTRVLVVAWFNSHIVKAGREFSPRFWENLFAFGVLLAGVGWGVVGSSLFPFGQIAYESFLGFVLAGTTAGAAVAYSSSLKSTFSFLLPATLPFGFMLILQGGSLRLSMAALLCLYVSILSRLMVRMNKYVVESIRLRFENGTLIRELEGTQAKALSSAKMAALGEMAGGIAHEINTPLATMKLKMEFLQDSAVAGDIEACLKLVSEVDQTITRVAKIISGLRNFSRDGDRDLPERVTVTQLIKETLEFCEGRFQSRGIVLEIDPIASTTILFCERVHIGQVLLNLLNNAFDAVEGQRDARVRIEVEESPTTITVAVVDNGPGVPPAVRHKIMQPFFTTKEQGKGTGLGLSISYGIVKNHGGTLELDDQSPQTRFVMTLPRPAATPRLKKLHKGVSQAA